MEYVDKEKNVQHLAGIVPIGGQPLDFKMPWHDSMMPIAQNYLAVERAVFQCVLAGCETVWVVGHLGTQPLIRKRIGDLIIDPVGLSINSATYKRLKEVSVYYVPIHPKDRLKRDCLGWSVLYGADSAFRIARFMSKWIAPEKFFCSFPYGIVPDEALRDNRLLLSTKTNVIYTHQEKSVKDNLHLPFTFNANDYFNCRDILKSKQIEVWNKTSLREFDIGTVFKGLDYTDSTMIELSWFHDISSWEGYKKYIASEQSNLYTKPINLFKGNKRKRYELKSSNLEENTDANSSQQIKV